MLCLSYQNPLSQITLILYLIDYKALKFNDWYVYPDWAYALGWTMTLSSVLMVPLWAAGQMCLTAGTFRQVSVQRKVVDHVQCEKNTQQTNNTIKTST